jgi:hypothetical protein
MATSATLTYTASKSSGNTPQCSVKITRTTQPKLNREFSCVGANYQSGDLVVDSVAYCILTQDGRCNEP